MTRKRKRSPAFQFYPSDFLGSAKVAVMDVAEIGAYWLLLCLDWEENGFTLEEAREFIVRRGRVSAEEFDIMWRKIARCFETESGRFFNARLRAERKKQLAWRRKSSKGGKLGMQKRWGGKDKGGYEMVTPFDNTPSPSPSPTPVTTTPKAKDGRCASRAAPADSSWLLRVAESYEQRKGSGAFPHGKAGKLLKPLHEAGHSGEEIATRLGRYVDWLDDPKYFSWARFRETFGDYAEEEPAAIRALAGYPQIVDDFGCLTEYGDRVTRPDGLRVA